MALLCVPWCVPISGAALADSATAVEYYNRALNHYFITAHPEEAAALDAGTTRALNGPDDLGEDGRWIPSTSIEQYGATLCRWLGMADSDMPYIFPNIGAFAKTNLGFMTT